MKLETHVLRALESFERGEKDDALMHATFAIEGTAKKLFGKGGKEAYKKCLRTYWWLIERFIGEGLNLEDTKFTYLKLDNGHGKNIESPDLADIVYHIFRCSHSHADEVPLKYQLLPKESGVYPWFLDRVNTGLRMPEAIIFALLAVSVFCKTNAAVKTVGEHHLTWGSDQLGYEKYALKEFWGKEDDIKTFFSTRPQTRVTIDFKNWET